MDKIEGENLQEWIEVNGQISQSLALNWLQQLVEILDLIHHTEFFHRDIKPANIILQPHGRLALVDFGGARRITDTYLAKVSASGGTSTRPGNYEVTAVVSPCYTPLEQINGKAIPQSDFYALGRTLVRLITGTSLISLPTDQKTGKLIWRDKAPQIDKPFADFIDELMAPLPVQRPATTEIILQRLKQIPQKNKIYRIIKSKAFQASVAIVFIVLGVLFIQKVLLPIRANILLTQGKKYEALNDSQSAQEYFDSAIEIDSKLKNDIAQLYFDKASRSTQNLQAAKKYYEISLRYNDRDGDTYKNLAFVCQLINEFDCVSSNYEKALKLKPDAWEVHYGLGTFYDDRGKDELAEQQYKLALKNNSQAIVVLNNLSRLKNIKGEHEAAIALALQGLQKIKEPKLQAALYKNLGWANLEQQKFNEAKEYLEKAEKLDPQRADIYCLLAQVQEALGDNDSAWLSWEACLILESKQPEVFRWREEVLQRIRLKSPNRYR
ncbi:protein kinase [Nostoc minutum NIES-26]|uniref:non-specific serine/threonine protein kinase n=1 Tax=Nostoc minutum NIES-26 TaxID=1844469 RepID=A0A367RX71_9NOSO|nr:protein kinase [Nostoc minutum NIES-26]